MARFARRPRRFATALATVLAFVPQVAATQGQAQASATLRLNEALHTLAQDPQYLPSLLGAGQASLLLDDVDAALGFFRRAEAVAPNDGRVKAGLAAAMVRQGQPLEALRLFAEAEQAGEPMRLHLANRGLAYDLIGDNARAQQDYRLALAAGADPIVTRRLALSQAIAGDRNGSEVTLLPLLQRGDLSAHRTRAFALAILGKADEAVSIAETMLPAQLSSRISPYLRYMPRLTRAQQAAAANLGSFPQAAQIGREDPALVAYAAQAGLPSSARGGADARLVPSGAPLGPRASDSHIPQREDPARQAAPAAARAVVQPLAEAPRPVPSAATPAPAASPLSAPPLPERAPPAVVVAALPPPPSGVEPPRLSLPTQDRPRLEASAVSGAPLAAVASNPSPPQESRSPAAVVANLPPAPSQAEPPPPGLAPPPPAQSPAAAVTAPGDRRDLSQAFAEFSLPVPPTVAPAQGAVDITRIEPRREAARAEAKPAAPPRSSNPSRHWVQVATGRDTAALEFDWRRVKREAGGLLDKTAPHLATWGQTNRLVAGPFASAREADELVTKLKDKKLDSFRFTSAQGEEVRRLD